MLTPKLLRADDHAIIITAVCLPLKIQVLFIPAADCFFEDGNTVLISSPVQFFYLISFLAWSGTFSAPSSPDQKPPIMQFARFLLKWVRMQRGWERVHFNNTQRLELETSKNKQQPCFNSPWRPRTNCRWRQKLCWRISFKYSWVKWVWTGTQQPCSGLKDTTSRSVEPTCDDRLPHCYTCSGSVETFL